MPFTLSHAAAALPFRRTRLDMSALVIGSFAPDFPYFMFFAPSGFIGHTPPGIFVFDLPLSLIVLWLFHAFIKRPLLMFLPIGVRQRLKPGKKRYSFWPPARLALIVISIVIGSATHILWDSFTHTFYWPYRNWSFLREIVHVPIAGDLGMYRVLQFGSSVFGIVVLVVWAWFWYRAAKPAESPIAEPYTLPQIRVIRLVVPAVALICGILRAYLDLGAPDMSIRSVMHFAIESGITTTTLLAIGMLICGAAFASSARDLKARAARGKAKKERTAGIS
jgi:hypothetical protein